MEINQNMINISWKEKNDCRSHAIVQEHNAEFAADMKVNTVLVIVDFLKTWRWTSFEHLTGVAKYNAFLCLKQHSGLGRCIPQFDKGKGDVGDRLTDARHYVKHDVGASLFSWKFRRLWNTVPWELLYLQILAKCDYVLKAK